MQSFKLMNGHQISDGRTDGTHARTGVTRNAPPPFFEMRGHNRNVIQVQRSSLSTIKQSCCF